MSKAKSRKKKAKLSQQKPTGWVKIPLQTTPDNFEKLTTATGDWSNRFKQQRIANTKYFYNIKIEMQSECGKHFEYIYQNDKKCIFKHLEPLLFEKLKDTVFDFENKQIAELENELVELHGNNATTKLILLSKIEELTNDDITILDESIFATIRVK